MAEYPETQAAVVIDPAPENQDERKEENKGEIEADYQASTETIQPPDSFTGAEFPSNLQEHPMSREELPPHRDSDYVRMIEANILSLKRFPKPITLYEGKILSGFEEYFIYNFNKANFKELGIQQPEIVTLPAGINPRRFLFATELVGRNLSRGQLALYILSRIVRKDPDWIKRHEEYVGETNRRKSEGQKNKKNDKKAEKDDRPAWLDIVSQEFGVSKTFLYNAQRIIDKCENNEKLRHIVQRLWENKEYSLPQAIKDLDREEGKGKTNASTPTPTVKHTAVVAEKRESSAQPTPTAASNSSQATATSSAPKGDQAKTVQTPGTPLATKGAMTFPSGRYSVPPVASGHFKLPAWRSYLREKEFKSFRRTKLHSDLLFREQWTLFEFECYRQHVYSAIFVPEDRDLGFEMICSQIDHPYIQQELKEMYATFAKMEDHVANE